jgi:hypothetical protein
VLWIYHGFNADPDPAFFWSMRIRIKFQGFDSKKIENLTAKKKLIFFSSEIATNGAAWLRMVRRGSVGRASACCKAGPSSILGSAPQGGSYH